MARTVIYELLSLVMRIVLMSLENYSQSMEELRAVRNIFRGYGLHICVGLWGPSAVRFRSHSRTYETS